MVMKVDRCFTAIALLFGYCVYLSCCQDISVTPETNLALPLNASENVTYTCTLTGQVQGSVLVFWEVQGVQVQVGQMIFNGIFIEELGANTTKIIITREARQMLEIRIRCTSFVIGPPLVVQLGPSLYVRTYGQPLPPENVGLLPSEPIMLAWERPGNIPEGVEINYTITVNSSGSALSGSFSALNTSQIPIPFLDLVMESGRCEAFQFYVMATVDDVPEGDLAVAMDTVPLSANVSSINRSLSVDLVDADNGNSISAQVSFLAVEPCSINFPIRNYTLTVDGRSDLTIPATPTMTHVMGSLTSLMPDQQFQVGVTACSDAACRSSSTRPLNTSDVQYAQVIFFENTISLSCSFASRSPARGCVFLFQVNQNGTETEEFIVLQSMEGRQCNQSANHRSGYLSISVQDLEADGVGRGEVVLPVDLVVLETEGSFTDRTGCVPSVAVDSRAVSIAVPIVVVLVLVALVTSMVAIGIGYFNLQKRKKAKFSKMSVEEDGAGETVFVDISSNIKKLITNSPLSKRSLRSVSQSLPLSKQAAALNPKASLPPQLNTMQTDHAPESFSLEDRGPPLVEVVLDQDSIRLKVNKPALRRMALSHSIAMKRAQSEGSLTLNPLEEQSLLAQATPSIKMTDEFKSMCYGLPPVEEEEAEELRSWGIINFTASPPPPAEKQSDSQF